MQFETVPAVLGVAGAAMLCTTIEGYWLLAIPMMVVLKAVCDRVEGLQPIGNMLGE